jgi:SAM-dependent methyltransferase
MYVILIYPSLTKISNFNNEMLIHKFASIKLLLGILKMNDFGGEFWDNKFSPKDFIYGIEPNNFFRESLTKLNPGRILMLGEGEGRNAVFAAIKNWKVDAIDFSRIAKEKALNLAKGNSVKINYILSNLEDYNFNPGKYDAVGNIFLHLHPTVRKIVHPRIISTLKKNGYLILEVFEKDQLGRSTGGPQNFDMLYSVEEIEKDFNSLRIILLEKKIIILEEGDLHNGESVVVRLLAQKV